MDCSQLGCVRAILPPWTLDAPSASRDDLLSSLSLCSSLPSLDIASLMRLHIALGMLCSVAVFSIYNAFPEHSKQENWEKRCLCVSWLCGCAQDVKQDVDGRYICSRLCSCVTTPVLLILMLHNRNSSWRVTQSSKAVHGCMHWLLRSCHSGVSIATQHCSGQHITMHHLPFSMIQNLDLFASPCSTGPDGMPAVV